MESIFDKLFQAMLMEGVEFEFCMYRVQDIRNGVVGVTCTFDGNMIFETDIYLDAEHKEQQLQELMKRCNPPIGGWDENDIWTA